MLMSASLIDLTLPLLWKKFAEPLIGVFEKVYATIGEQASGVQMKSSRPMEFVTDSDLLGQLLNSHSIISW